MPIFYPEGRMSDTIKFCCSLSGMLCQQNMEYGVIGKKKRAGIWGAEDQNGFTIKHVRLEKESEKQTRSFFQANGMRFGPALPPVNGVCQMGSRPNETFEKRPLLPNFCVRLKL